MNKAAFSKFIAGLYIVSSRKGNRLNGHVSNSVVQVSSSPALFSIACHKENFTSECILESKAFSVSVLQQDVDLEFLSPWGFKSGADINKFENRNFVLGSLLTPILLEKTIAWIDCKLVNTVDVGSHYLFIGEAIDSEVEKEGVPPLSYPYYHEVIKGISPEHAPTYMEHEMNLAVADGETNQNLIYKCTVCGYEYNPLKGDFMADIPPNTSFADLPADWRCPLCNVGKEFFEPLNE